MVNYYNQFTAFKKNRKLVKEKEYSLKEFEQHMLIFFGFGGRNNAARRWITNFNDAGLIEIIKKDTKDWVIKIL